MEILKTEFSDRIDKITASVWHNDAHISYGGEFTSATLYGVLPQTQPIDGIQIVEGRFINETDVKEKRKVVVLDDLACRVLFKDGGSPVGRMVQIDKMGYTVVGTYKGLSYSYTSQIYGPLSSVLLTYMGDKRDVASISFTVRGIDTEEQSDLFKRQLRTRLGAEHSFSPEDKSAIWINDRMESYQQTMTIFHGIALFIWIIGIGTLTAGIVGVSNIMLVTVRERTSEFGIRKAMGARPSSLVKLVLLESVLITAAFGYVGLIGGVGVMEAVNFFMDRAAAASPSQFSMFKNPTLDLSTAVSATLVLIVAGMIAGYVPARRAARIKAIDAMRHNKSTRNQSTRTATTRHGNHVRLRPLGRNLADHQPKPQAQHHDRLRSLLGHLHADRHDGVLVWGLRNLLYANLNGMNENPCFLWGGKTSIPYKGLPAGRYWQLDNDDMRIIETQIPGIKAVGGVFWGSSYNFRAATIAREPTRSSAILPEFPADIRRNGCCSAVSSTKSTWSSSARSA